MDQTKMGNMVMNEKSDPLDTYDVIWNSPSENSRDSMPCGGGDIGLNVWVENDQILFYAMRSGCFDENNAFPKLGRFRLHFPTVNFAKSLSFEQRLRLGKGSVLITCNTQSKGVIKIHIWVDVFNPVIHVDVVCDTHVILECQYESWRMKDRLYDTNEQMETEFGKLPDAELVKKSDNVLNWKNGILFYHRNSHSTSFNYTVYQQCLNKHIDKLSNPLCDLTFGGWMGGEDLVPTDETITGVYQTTPYMGFKLASSTPKRQYGLKIVTHINQTENIDQWYEGIQNAIDSAFKTDCTLSEKWWSQFWDRSHIFINSDDPFSAEWKLGRNYQLFRYMMGCNAYGSYPTKFNGGLFTFDPHLVDTNYKFTPDFRKWGGGVFTAQNQRLLYWPLLMSGDSDMLKPFFDFYLNLLQTARLRAQHYFKVPGAFFNEQINNYGLENPFDWISTEIIYGRSPPINWPIGVEWNDWLAYSWDTILEVDTMILDAQEFGKTDIKCYIPLIIESVKFFDEFYQCENERRSLHRLNQKGHLVLYPGSALETYKTTYNSITTIAGLTAVVKKTLQLSSDILDDNNRKYFEQVLLRIPDLPMRNIGNRTVLAPAIAFDRIQNSEIPQMYPIFPYGIYGVGKPNLSIAIDTYNLDPEIQGFKSHIGWKQDNIFCARMGMSESAAYYTSMKLADSSDTRFPTFWGPGFDWTPDHNWGGSGMIGLQNMLVQTSGRNIIMLPAWPKNWAADFKLHINFNTTVEGCVNHGVVSNLVVTPSTRMKDVIICPTWKCNIAI